MWAPLTTSEIVCGFGARHHDVFRPPWRQSLDLVKEPCVQGISLGQEATVGPNGLWVLLPGCFLKVVWVGYKHGLFLFSIFTNSPLGTCGSFLNLDFTFAVISAILYGYIIIILFMQ